MFEPSAVDLPTVIIGNVSEPFLGFLRHDPDRSQRRWRIRLEHYLADRSLLWAPVAKLVVTPFPVPSADYIRTELGYSETVVISPEHPSDSLCRDILRDRRLFDELVRYAGPKRALSLVPYATTPQFLELADALRRRGSLAVRLPDSPSAQDRWLIDYAATKGGFRALVGEWISHVNARLPVGFVCQSRNQASMACLWFLSRGRACILKANDGESGLGNIVVQPSEIESIDDLGRTLEQHPLLARKPIVVEEFLGSDPFVSPSYEGYVPPKGSGNTRTTYLSSQVLQGHGEFAGVLISRDHEQESWYRTLEEAGSQIGDELQGLGFVGHFDLDAVVRESGDLYLVEINPRRTGGTHVHEMAVHLFGSDYTRKVVLLSNDSAPTGQIMAFDALSETLGDLLYRYPRSDSGVIPTVTSSLPDRFFGWVIVGESLQDVLRIKDEMLNRLRSK